MVWEFTVTIGAGLMVMQTVLEVTGAPHPLTTAWKQVFAVIPAVVNVAVVAPGILVHGPPAVGALCHWIPPELPVSVRFTGVPEQTAAGATDAVPATGAGTTLMVILRFTTWLLQSSVTAQV